MIAHAVYDLGETSGAAWPFFFLLVCGFITYFVVKLVLR